MSVIKEEFGFAYGYKTYLFTIENENGMRVKLTNFGASIVGIEIPSKTGGNIDVVLGYDDNDGYVGGNSSQGAVVGRYANRIGGAKFTLNDIEYNLSKNDGENCLHGGFYSYNKRVWNVDEFVYDEESGETEEDYDKDYCVTFSYFSPDGEENFPGDLSVQVKYTLTADNALKIDYYAASSEDTIINLTNHSYFNLGGCDSGSVLDHELQIFAEEYTPVNDALIPLGTKDYVAGTVFDFREAKRIGADIISGDIGGYDHNFVLSDNRDYKKAAVAYCEKTGIQMTVYTDMPAMQLYTANGLNETGKGGKQVGPREAFCLETQFTPNTPNMPNFPSCVLEKGTTFMTTTSYQFSIK